MSPEQSNVFGPSAPHSYGLPIWSVAYFTAFLPCSDASLLIAARTPELSQADCAWYAASSSSFASRSFSFFSSRDSSFSASEIRCLIFFLASALVLRSAPALAEAEAIEGAPGEPGVEGEPAYWEAA